VYVQTLAPSDSVYDFGVAGTGMGQAGMNSFHGNGAYQVLFNGNGTLSAIGDWWGTPAPVDTVEFLAQGGGVIVVTPALAVSPVP
jgi:hypothetical protein